MTRLRVTEHTTTDDPRCVCVDIDTGDEAEFLGSIDELRAVLSPGVEIVEEVWS